MAGKIPQHFIDELVSRTDIVAVIGERVTLTKAGIEFKARCPFHEEKSPSFYVSPQKQFYHCFGCSEHGTAISFLMNYDRMSFIEAIEALSHRAGLEVPKTEGAARVTHTHEPLYALLEKAKDFFLNALAHSETARDYLNRRGLSDATQKTFAIGYAQQEWDALFQAAIKSGCESKTLVSAGLIKARDDNNSSAGFYDRFRDRIMFPIRNARGRVIAFGGRVIAQGEPKYLNSPETPVFNKRETLYGIYEMLQQRAKTDSIVVVEGYMDVVGLAQAGVENAVATLGTSISEHHLRQLFRLTQRVVVCFDADNAGRKAAWRALQTALGQLDDGLEMAFMFLPEGEDPDSFVRQQGVAAWHKLAADSTPLSQYMIEQLLSQTTLSSVEGRAKLADQARPLIKRMRDSLLKTLLIKEIAKLCQLDNEQLESKVSTMAKQRYTRPRRPADSSGRGSLLRQALRTIVHFPNVIEDVNLPDSLRTIERPGFDLLNALYEAFEDSAGSLTTANLLERWRDREGLNYLERFALEEVLMDDRDAIKALESTFARLVKDETKFGRREILLEKARLGAINSEEKQELRNILAQLQER